MPVRRDALFSELPAEWRVPMLPLIQRYVQKGAKVVVLDDDPTGTQTVHDVAVLTHWPVGALVDELRQPDSVVYILTNSRAYAAERARQINLEIAAALRSASEVAGRQVAIVSRSDSTLRGHFSETEALIEGLQSPVDGLLVVPFFLEGGRYTIDDVHYVDEGGWLVPAAETEFARDPVFGYQESNLRAWVSARSGGAWSPEEVASISLSDLRIEGPRKVEILLSKLADAQPCVVNAVSYRDLEVLVAGILASEMQGHRYLYRTAASFVRVRAGLEAAPLLSASDFWQQRGGLVVVGSFVGRTTAQLEEAARLPDVVPIELDAAALLGTSASEVVARARKQAASAMAGGHDALVYTSREHVGVAGTAASLDAGQKISAGLVALVAELPARPAWVIAKGGITSSDIATGALNIQRALVRGQAIPGIPVWRTGPESRWPDLDYVVFPGNVGGPGALAEMISILRGSS